MKIENQVVSLELAKELKDAGYPQEGVWWWCQYNSKEWGVNHRLVGFNNIVAPTVAELGEALLDLRNEFAQGWSDSGCHWHFQAGDRGCGSMIEGFGKTFDSESEDTEADARAKMWLYLKQKGLK